jgi:hypothetical protein
VWIHPCSSARICVSNSSDSNPLTKARPQSGGVSGWQRQRLKHRYARMNADQDIGADSSVFIGAYLCFEFF